MRLSDIMSSMQLASYAEVALLLFLGAFATIAVSLFWSREAAAWDRYRHLPLDAEEPSPALPPAAPTPSLTQKNHEP